MLVYIKYFSKYYQKVSWCLQNFLTMEFYRKICNNYYWSNIYNTKHNIIKQSLIIFVSFLSMMFFSFFYLPTDPANINKTSFILKSIKYISEFKLNSINISDILKSNLHKIFFASVFTEEGSCISSNPARLKTVLLI
ncbi:MAG: hypothetical protein HGGPFJEG_00348 [Ignavibacteria bacterium]|nr:hypothetical protein [Ignavibacteria bacterium]